MIIIACGIITDIRFFAQIRHLDRYTSVLWLKEIMGNTKL
jgi:hypothetical protein